MEVGGCPDECAAEAERRFGPAATPGARVAKEVACGAAAAAVGGPVSHAPSVVAAYQQATNAPLAKAIGAIYAAGGGRAFFRGLPARTLSLAGTFAVVPYVLDLLATV